MSIGSWFKRILFGKNGRKPHRNEKYQPNRSLPQQSNKTKTQKKPSVAVNTKYRSSRPSERQTTKTISSRYRFSNVEKAYLEKIRNQQRSKNKSVKPVQKEKKSAFSQFVEKAKQKAVTAPSNSAQTSRFGSYNKSKPDMERLAKERVSKIEESRKQARQSVINADIKSGKEKLIKELEARKAAPLSKESFNQINKEIKKTKKNYEEKYKQEQKKAAAANIRSFQNNYTGETRRKQLEEIKEQAKKVEAKEQAYKKKNRSELLTTDEMLRRQFAEANPTYRTRKGGDKIISEELQEKLRANMQKGLDSGSAVEGFLRGSTPVADLNKMINKKYGVELDDTRAKKKVGYNIGEMAGYLFKSGAFGGMSEATIAKALQKAVAKKTGKTVLSKGGKFAINRVSEAAASLPINVEDAAKNSKDVKDFGKNLAINAALDAGFGTALDGGTAAVKAIGVKNVKSAVAKINRGEALTEAEQKSLKNSVSKVVNKSAKKRELTDLEKEVAKHVNSGEAQKAIARKPYKKFAEINPITKISDSVQGRKDDKKFSKQVDEALNGELKSRDELTVGRTPRKLQKYGASDSNMTMKQDTVLKTAYPAGYIDALRGLKDKKSQGHNLGVGTVKQLREDLNDPVSILKSDTQNDSFVVFTKKVDKKGNPILVAIHLDKNGSLGVSNEVASAYGKDGYEEFIAKQREKGNVLYENKKIGLEELPGSGLQLPELGDKSDPINTLYQNDQKVNNVQKKEAPYTANANALASTSDNAYTDTSISNSVSDSAQKSNTEAKNADVEQGKSLRSGRVTTIKDPYKGKTPDQGTHTSKVVEVKTASVSKAKRNIDEANGNKSLIKKAYEKVFADEGGARTKTIKGVSYEDKPYDVFLGKKAVGKVVSDANMSPEKLAVFDNINEIIEEAKYVGSGNYIQHGAKNKLTERFDYFETEAKIGDTDYIVSFDVEVFPNTNNYRTHKITKIDLTPVSNADVGPAPTAKETNASLINNSIPDSAQKINIEAEKSTARTKTYEDVKTDPNTANVLIDTKKEKDSFSKRTKDFMDKAAELVTDDLHYIEKAAKEIGGENGDRLYHMADNKRRLKGQVDNIMYHAQVDYNGHKIGNSVKDIIGRYVGDNKKYQKLNDYIYHRVNIERYPKGKYVFGKDVTDVDSTNIVKELEAGNPEFKDTFDECVKFFRNERNVMEEAGIIAPGEYDVYENFISVHRDVPKGAKTNKNVISANRGLYKATGSNLDILPIHEQMFRKAFSNRKAIANNEIVKTLSKAEGISMKDVPSNMTPEEFIESGITTNTADGKFYGGYWEDGKYHSRQIDKEVYNALNGMVSADKMLLKNAWRGTDIFKKLITDYSIWFTFRNGAKDAGEALFQAESLPRFLAAYPKAIKEIATNGKYYQMWKGAGGKYSNIISLKDGLKVRKGYEKIAAAMNPLEWIHHLNYAVETIPRLTEFIAIMDKELAGNGIEHATRDMVSHAAHGSSDVTTNFSRGGTAVKQANRTLVPFLNPSVQGVNKLYRVLMGQKGIKGYAALTAKLLAIGFAPGAIQDIIYQNDEDYNNLSERDKNNALMIKGEDGQFTKFWYMSRMPGTMSIPMRQALRTYLGTGEMDFKEITDAFKNNMAPVSPLEGSIVSPIFKAHGNETWYGGEIDSYTDMKKPAGERTNKDTTVAAKFIGRELGISPQRIDYVLDAYTGIAGDIVMPMLTADQWRRALNEGKSGIKATLKYGAKNIYDRNMKVDPVFRNKLATEYYELYEKAEQDGNSKGATIEDKAKAKYFKENSYRVYEINDALAEVEENPKLTVEQRMEKRKELKIALNGVYRTGVEGNKEFSDYVKKHENDFDTKKSLYAAAWRQVEKEASSVKQLDVIKKVMGVKYVLKQESCYYTDDGDKKEFKDKRGNTVYDYGKKFVKAGGSWERFYQDYKVLRKYNKETGGSLDLAYSSAIPILVKGKRLSKKIYDAYGVTDKDKKRANLYFERGGTVKEFEKASEYMTNACNAGNESNYFAPFKAIGLAKMKATDRVYDAVDSDHVSVKTAYKMNTGRGLVAHKISAKRLAELNDKCKKDLNGYNIKKSVEKVLDKTDYSQEEKALLWDALYGLSYKETNPYGSIGDYSLKSDVGIDTSGGYKHYGSGRGYRHSYRRYGHRGYRYSGRSGRMGDSTEEKTEFEKYVERLLRKQQTREIIRASMNYSKLNTKKYSSDQYRKAIAKLLAKRLMDK